MKIDNLLEQHKHQQVILIDMSWLLYRSYYAFQQLTNQDGIQTGQYFGLSNTLQTIKEFYPNNLILLVDDGKPVLRKELNESYKANREQNSFFYNKRDVVDCIIQKLPNVYRVFNSVVEADDLLFSISRIKDFNNQFIIFTSDKDLYQALDETTFLSSELKHGRFILKDTQSDQYKEFFQDLEPFQVPYYRAVVGDPSDNLKSIYPRFPKKIAYYFAKNYVFKAGAIFKPQTKPDDLTDKNYEHLLNIYSSEEFITNLEIMKLEPINIIPIMEKNKSEQEVQETLRYLQLNKFLAYINNPFLID